MEKNYTTKDIFRNSGTLWGRRPPRPYRARITSWYTAPALAGLSPKFPHSVLRHKGFILNFRALKSPQIEINLWYPHFISGTSYTRQPIYPIGISRYFYCHLYPRKTAECPLRYATLTVLLSPNIICDYMSGTPVFKRGMNALGVFEDDTHIFKCGLFIRKVYSGIGNSILPEIAL